MKLKSMIAASLVCLAIPAFAQEATESQFDMLAALRTQQAAETAGSIWRTPAEAMQSTEIGENTWDFNNGNVPGFEPMQAVDERTLRQAIGR